MFIRFQIARALYEAAADPADGGAGGGGQPSVQFTPEQQAVFERTVKERLSKAESGFQKTIGELKAETARLAEIAKENEELKHQIGQAGKGDAERKAADAERQATLFKQQLEATAKERDEAVGSLTKVQQERDADHLYREVSSALAKAGCLPSAVQSATFEMIRAANVRAIHEEGGSIKVTAELGTFVFNDAKSAAEAFLKQNRFYAAAADGGGGNGRGNAGVGGQDILKLSPRERIALGLNSKA